MMSGSARSARVIERMIASMRPTSLSSISTSRTSFGMPGSMPMMLESGPIFLMALHLFEEVVERERAFHQALRGHLGLLGVEGLLGLLDERQHVAHAEDAAGQAVGVEQVEVLELLAGRGEGDRADRRPP